MAARRNEEPIPSQPRSADDDVFYPTNDDERMWVLSQDVRELVKQTLEPKQAERLLAKLDLLFRNWGIYPPSI